MEHRRYMRVPAGLDTLIYHHGLPVGTGRIRDACRGGIFVETTFSGLYDHQLLECEFRVAQDSVRLGAHVVRHDPSGVALWIDDDDRAAVDALRTLLGACGPIPVMRLPHAEAGRTLKAQDFTEA
jgi:hypothetical protein